VGMLNGPVVPFKWTKRVLLTLLSRDVPGLPADSMCRRGATHPRKNPTAAERERDHRKPAAKDGKISACIAANSKV